MIPEWLTLNRNESKEAVVIEKVLETPMGFIFLRETTSKKTGSVSEAMTSIQCNRIQFKWFIETRMNDNKTQSPLLRLYRGKKK